MKALVAFEIGTPEKPGTLPALTNYGKAAAEARQTAAADLEKERMRTHRNRAGLMSLMGLNLLDLDTTVDYETGIVDRWGYDDNNNYMLLEKALLTYVDIHNLGATETIELRVDHGHCIDSNLATDLGAEANQAAVNGNTFYESSNAGSDTRHRQALERTAALRIAQLARLNSITPEAVGVPQFVQPSQVAA